MLIVANQAVLCLLKPLHAHEVILVPDELQTLLELSDWVRPCRFSIADSGTRVVFVVVVNCTLVFEFLRLNELFNLVQICQPFAPEVLQLHYGLSEEALFEHAVDELAVVFFCVEARENLHLVNDITLFF